MVKIIVPSELSETELISYKDNLYEEASKGVREFHNLMEVICCRENIIDAIRKIKANNGFNTEGVDGIIGNDILQSDAEEFFAHIQQCFESYEANRVRRVYIPKRNGKERPLGIPAVMDKIVQTAIANILEPIFEGIFYEHSYGFRPMRDISQVYGYLSAIVNTNSNRHWVVEGDIKGFFDNVNHQLLINKLYKYGVRDKRLLMIIKKILKAGIVDKNKIIETNKMGTPQGGTLSPLLANIYLTEFDLWVDGQWRKFQTDKEYANQNGRIRNLRNNSNLKEGYLIRYADDWIIVTSSEDEAIRWKYACQNFFRNKLKLELSEEKTIITNLETSTMDFLGITSWVARGSKNKLTLRTKPSDKRLKEKMSDVYKHLKNIRQASNDALLVEAITKYNAVIRGLNNFYQITTNYSIVMSKEEWKMKDALQRTLHTAKLKRVKAKNCQNLTSNKAYTSNECTTLAYCEGNVHIGMEKLGIGKFKRPFVKCQRMTPYSQEGRTLYEQANGHKWNTLPRNQWLTLGEVSNLIAKNSNKIYNLEYFINRPMAFNRDKGRCRVCKKLLTSNEMVNIHHINKDLPLDKINKLSNLVTTCTTCHYEAHKRRANRTKQNKVANTHNGKTVSTKSAIKPPKEVLAQQITKYPFTQLAKMYGVSDNAVRKWAKSYDIYDKRMIQLKK